MNVIIYDKLLLVKCNYVFLPTTGGTGMKTDRNVERYKDLLTHSLLDTGLEKWL